ncbi:hypothetical protein [Kaistia sp. MMO-174]
MKTVLDFYDAVRGSERDDWLALAFLPAMAGLAIIFAIGFAP